MLERRYYGAIVAPPPANAWRYPAAVAALPSSVLLDVGPVRHQRARNSCTGHAFASLMYVLSRIRLIASALGLYYYFKKRSGFAPAVDAGAYMDDCAASLVEDGVGSEAVWPYGVNGEKYATEPPLAYRQQAADHRAMSWYRALSLSALKSALAAGLPVALGFEVPASFENIGLDGQWRDGGGAPLGGHAVCAYGYDDATQRIRVRNSWGDSWGFGGDFFLPYSEFPGQRFFDAIVVTAVDVEAGA